MRRCHDRCRPDHVERYLRRLARWAPRKSRHDLVMEASRHLYEATRRGEEAGLTPEAAQRAAIRAFGPAWRIGLAERGLLDTAAIRARLRMAQVIRRARRPRPRPHLF